jgi:hypothetical protein
MVESSRDLVAPRRASSDCIIHPQIFNVIFLSIPAQEKKSLDDGAAVQLIERNTSNRIDFTLHAMENLSLEDRPAQPTPPPQMAPQLPPQMFTTAAQLLNLTDSELAH